MDTVRIELDGDYAVVLKEMVHKTTKLIRQKMIQTLGNEEYLRLQDNLRKVDNDEDKKAILRKIQIENDDEIILLNQIVEWSFGDVTQVILDKIPSAKYDKLASEVDKLYSQVPLAEKK